MPEIQQEAESVKGPAWAILAEAIDARLNPVLVKDIRCWLRSKKFLVVFFLGSAAALTATLAFIPLAALQPSAGRPLFGVLVTGLGFVLGGIVPFLIQNEFSEEFASGSTELALISRMTPAQLVRGKILSGLLAALLFFSAVGPSLAIAYLLGGISILEVAYTIAALLFFSTLSTLLSVLAIAIVGAKGGRLVGLLPLISGFLIAAFETLIVFQGPGRVMQDKEFWLINGFFGSYLALVGLFLYAVATSRLSFPADNRDLWPRLTLTLVTGYSFAAIALMPWFYRLLGASSGPGREAYLVAMYGSMITFFIGCFFILNTAQRLSMRVVSRWPRSTLWALFFYPGTGRLYAYLFLHMLAFIAAGLGCTDFRELLIVEGAVLCGFTLFGAGFLVHSLFQRIGREFSREIVVAVTAIAWTVVGVVISSVSMVMGGPEEVFLVNPLLAVGFLTDSRSSLGPTENRFLITVLVLSPVLVPTLVLWAKEVAKALAEDYDINLKRTVQQKIARKKAAEAAAKEKAAEAAQKEKADASA